MTAASSPAPDPIEALLGGSCGDPRGVLGVVAAPAGEPGGPSTKASRTVTCTLRVFLPPARRVWLELPETGGTPGAWEAPAEPGPAGREGAESGPLELQRVHREGVFELGLPSSPPAGYRLRVAWDGGDTGVIDDPYRFEPRLRPLDLEDFAEGAETALHELLGAHAEERDGVRGTRFAVWAPRALAVNVMGSFNGWEARRSPMYPIGGDTGVWELFLPGVRPGAMYKFQIRAEREGERVALDKADPLGRRMEVRPRTASVVTGPTSHEWKDAEWLGGRAERVAPGRPISIYEVHLGSWRRGEDGSWLDYGTLAETLLPYVRDLGFTHIELLPVTEHPHDASWGYQTVGYFALTSRYGDPDAFRRFVDEAHRLGLGVILDWVPGHFPRDAHGLALFDGEPLYEPEDPRRASHPDWGTVVFDYGRPEVISFLVSSALFWLEEYHLDGLRVDAVASMIYLDYSRGPGEWEPNEEGGRENLEAVAFLKRLTTAVHERVSGALLFAEESTSWPGITAPVEEGGLGFDFKWNMGWMNDTLRVVEAEPARRPSLHDRLTFSMVYAHGERHLLPLSHDEVVHLKRSLLAKMPGGPEAQRAGLRLLLGYMWTHPGAKLVFMGAELGVGSEWDEAASLRWEVLEEEGHAGIQRWLRALNGHYSGEAALHALDERPEGFEWLDVHDAQRSALSYLRWAPDWKDFLVVLANFAASPWRDFRLAVPSPGPYETALDSDDPRFGGRGRTRIRGPALEKELHGRPASLVLDVPPLSLIVLRRAGRPATDASGPASPGGDQPA